MEHQLSKFDKTEEGLYKLYDRFSFDDFFRILLSSDYARDEALDFILNNCALSTLFLQERIYNRYYMRLFPKGEVSEDLRNLRNEILLEIVTGRFRLCD